VTQVITPVEEIEKVPLPLSAPPPLSVPEVVNVPSGLTTVTVALFHQGTLGPEARL
jgi:hypothetical protein